MPPRPAAPASTPSVLRALAVGFAVIAVACMVAALVGMATDSQSARTGWIVRAVAVVCFVTAVILNVAAH
jgi:hypothetical protein